MSGFIKISISSLNLVRICCTGNENDRELWQGSLVIHIELVHEKNSSVISSSYSSTRINEELKQAEYKALADPISELTWLLALLHELGIGSSSTPILWCDNLGATYLSANPIFRAHTKHVKIDYHFVRKKVAQGDLRVQHISTHD
nr:Gag/Pol polyprotein [Tanacetum cinerariifolium]